MNKIPENPFQYKNLTVHNKLLIRFPSDKEKIYSIREVWHDKIVIYRENRTDRIYKYNSQFSKPGYGYDFDIYVLDKKDDVEYFL